MRLKSIDALRGLDMLVIVGGSWVLYELGVLLGGEHGWLAQQMCHVEWEGLHVLDCVFPLFVFISGLTFPFSYARQRERGDSVAKVHAKILKRAALLLFLGLLYNGFLKSDLTKLADFRYFSVLGKIGIAWGVAALVYVHSGVRTRIWTCIGVLTAYAVLLMTVVAPDAPAGTSPLTLEGCFPGYLDRLFTPGHLYLKDMLEPSGPFVSFFGFPTALLGMLAGDLVRIESWTPRRRVGALALTGLWLLALGLMLARFCPIVKMLWTPSFALVTGGIGFLLFALLHGLIDVKGWDGWSFPLRVVGMNAITVYFLSAVIDFTVISDFFLRGIAGLCGACGNLIRGVGSLAVRWLFLYWLYRMNLFLKI